MKSIYLQIPERQAADLPMALATITGTTGSTPQKSGCSALFDQAGLLSGTIGGGILEAKVQEIVNNILPSRQSGFYHFTLDNDISQQEEAICGGQVNILLDASPGDHRIVFGQVRKSMLERIPGILITQITAPDSTQVSIHRIWVSRGEKYTLPSDHLLHLEPVIKSMLSGGRAAECRELAIPVGESEIRYFLEPLFPWPRLVIVGAGHIGKALAHLGNLLEFEVWVIDDRPEFANPDNIPYADQIVVDDIGRAMQSVHLTPDTYVVIVTRGHRDDASALRSCMGGKAAYIGMIGSRKKIALMRNNFISEGYATPEQWDSIHAPVGLDIHSETVQEIAVSIAAQLIQVRNQKTATHV